MYCRKCGRKIEAGAVKCRKCGEPVDTAEICGGFWGLVESSGTIAEGKQNSLIQEQALKDKDARIRSLEGRQNAQTLKARSWRTRFFIMTAATGLLAVALIISSILGGSKKPDPGPEPAELAAGTGASRMEKPAPGPGGAPGEGGPAGGASEQVDASGENTEETDQAGNAGSGTESEEAGPADNGEEKPGNASDSADTIQNDRTDFGINSIERGAGNENYKYNGIEHKFLTSPIQIIENDVEEDKEPYRKVKFKDKDGNESSYGGYSRIEYTRQDNGNVLIRVLKIGGSALAFDSNGTVRILDQQEYKAEQDQIIVEEIFEGDNKKPNKISKDWMPDYNKIVYTYNKSENSNEYNLESEKYYLTGEDKKGDNLQPVLSIEYNDPESTTDEDGNTLFEITGKIADDKENALFDTIKIRYSYDASRDQSDKYRLRELSYRKNKKPVAGPDGFAVLRCSYDEEGTRTEGYFADSEGKKYVSLSEDPMLSWENTWLLFSEDFEQRFFRTRD